MNQPTANQGDVASSADAGHWDVILSLDLVFQHNFGEWATLDGFWNRFQMSNMLAGKANCQDPDRCVGFTLTVPNRRFRILTQVYIFWDVQVSQRTLSDFPWHLELLNLLWGPRFGGQTGCCHTSPPNPTPTPTSCPHSFRPR